MNESRSWTRIFLYLGTLIPDLLYGWPVILICHAAWGDKGTLRWEDGVLRTRAAKDSWLDKQYSKRRFAATTLTPHSILYRHMSLWPEELNEPMRTQRHEHVHVEQGEAAGLHALVVGFVYFGVLMGIGEPIWATVLLLVHLLTGSMSRAGAAQLTAVLRGEADHRGYSGAYWGAHTEEAARAREDVTHEDP